MIESYNFEGTIKTNLSMKITLKKPFMTVLVSLCLCQSTVGQTNNASEITPASSDLSKATALMTAKLEVNSGTQFIKDTTLNAEKMDQSVIVLRNDGNLEMKKSIIKKIGGDVSSENYSMNFGLNSAIVLMGANASLKLENCGIRTESVGSNGIFLATEGARAALNNLTIVTTMNGSSCLLIRSKGSITSRDIDASTMGAYSPAISVSVGSLNVKGGVVKTYGTSSPGIFSSGNVFLEDVILDASSSVCAVIDGIHSIILKNSAMNSGLKRNVILYQSKERSTEPGSSSFTMSGGSLDAKTGNLFYTTNTQYEVLLNHVNILKSGKKTALLKAASDKWGSKNNNGAEGIIHLNQQEIQGDVECDKLSSCNLILSDHSTWTGAINEKKTAKLAIVSIDETSTWTLSGSSYVQELSDAKADLTNIIGNGNSLYYDAKNPQNAWLGGKTIPLSGGGNVLPY
jgi:hypothetical protein